MPLLIDGHNLIGSGVLDGISLQDEDDELRFVMRLRVWRSGYRGKVTVIFDRGVVGGASRDLSGAGVEVIFARNPQEADDLILRRIRKRPDSLTVVTNDAQLRREAELHDVETWRAHEFVDRMSSGGARSQSRGGAAVERGAETDVQLSENEVSDWMKLFGPPRPGADAAQRATRDAASPASGAFRRDTEKLGKKIRRKRSGRQAR